MMNSQYRANINVLVSSLAWGLAISLAIWASRWFITDDGVFYILWRGGNFLALILYPLLVYVILRRKTNLWVNTFFFFSGRESAGKYRRIPVQRVPE